jgi:hypothetical protein
MTIDDEIYAQLRALTSPADQVFPVAAPEGFGGGDHLVFQRVASVPENHLEGSSGLIRSRFTVFAFASSYEAARALLNSVRAAMAGWTARQVIELGDNPDIQDEDTLQFASSADFAIWHD